MSGGNVTGRFGARRAALLSAVLMGSTALAGMIAPAPAMAQSSASAQRQFNIPAQSLREALLIFSQQSGLQVTAQGPLVEGRTSTAVSGNLAPAEALSRLLTGTGLTFRFDGRDAVRLEPAPQAAEGTVQLGPVRVEGSSASAESYTSLSSDPASTEGTGSYSARAATIGKGGVRSLREIPQSVSVMTNQQIEDQALRTVAEALEQAPGIYGTSSNGVVGGISRVYESRGYDMAYTVDGMAANNTFIQSAAQTDDAALADRIEIIRGPAALLRSGDGAGAFGGSINLVRKRPLRKLGVLAEVSAGSWNNFRGMADLTGPLNASGSIRARGVVTVTDRDFFYGPESHDRNWMGYGILEVDLTPRTMLTLSVVHSEARSDQQYLGVPRYSPTELVTHDRSFNQNRDQGFQNIDSTTFNAKLMHELSDEWKLSAEINYNKYDRTADGFSARGQNWVRKTDNAATVFYRLRQDVDAKTLSYDVNLSGGFDFLGQRHTVTFGADGSRYHYMLSAISTLDGTGVDIFDTALEFPVLSPTPNPFDRRYPQSAFYAVGQFKLADPLTLIVGGRLSNFKYKERTLGLSDWKTTLRETGRFTPYGGLVLDVTRQLSFYASYADIFLPQSQIMYNGDTLPPRIGWQAEVGAKGSFFDDRLDASLALYRIRDTNRGMRDPDPTHVGPPCGTSATSACLTPAGLVQSQGIDVEVSGSPFEGLQISASYTYNENKYLRDTRAANVGAQFNSFTPRHLVKLWATYRFGTDDSFSLPRWKIGAGVVAQSKVESLWSTNTYVNPGRAVFNASAGYQISDRFSVDANLNNVFDKKYLSHADANWTLYGEPRNVMVTLRSRF